MTAHPLLPAAPSADEHERYRCYLAAFARVSPDGEADLVRAVLADEDQVMAGAAVLHHLEQRAAAQLHAESPTTWAASFAPLVAAHPFAARRLREWLLLAAIARGEPWDRAALASATDWLQRTLAEVTTSREALTYLATEGRTRRARNTATTRLRRRT
ncbi:hypothetical protein [Kitasatospora sp. NPDC093806]|uniref:hypothetical protein n=1 Tax=Kitasatospora sp. NPDC093806 TaxID=3155075 RepID=UPI00342B7B8E